MVLLVITSLLAMQTSSDLDRPDGFCRRLAGDLGMTPQKPSAEGRQVWAASTKRGLFKSQTVAIKVGLRDEDLTVENIKRHARDCAPTPRGGACMVVGPVVFSISLGPNQTRDFDVRSGEQAFVRVVDTRLECEAPA